MHFHSTLASYPDLDAACDAAADDLIAELGPGGFDVAFAFASSHFDAALDRLPVLLHERLVPRAFVGCTGANVLRHDHMTDTEPALCVMAGRVPGARIATAAIANADLPSADAPPAAWRELLPDVGDCRGMLVLGEPFHCDMRALLAGLDFALPNVPKVGGLASGSRHPGGNPLFVGRSRIDSGAVLMSFGGDMRTTPVVAQGCRPIGRPGRVTKADRNRLVAVDDVPARRFVEEQLATLPREDAALARRSPLFLGIASDPFAIGQPTAGDYLVRNVLGIDPRGHVVVGEHVTVGRSVQLHLRDGESGLMDLERQLTRARAESAGAALMFRCIGRDGADHDLFAGVAEGVPMAGCTCYGEIGPVGETTHLHGYTATCLLLRDCGAA